jgi:hypothetical protein
MAPLITYNTYLDVITSTAGYIDLTSTLLSFTTDLDCGIFTMGRASASFTVKNFDNAFTPNAGGTYASTNWFGSKFTLRMVIDGNTTYLFDGICTDFSIDSGYKDSRASFTCVDAFQMASSTRTDIVGITSLEPMSTKIAQVLTNAQFPVLGEVSSSSRFRSIGVSSGSGTQYSGSLTPGSVSDLFSSRHIPSSGSISWPVLGKQLGIGGPYTYDSVILYETPYKSKFEIYGPYFMYGSDITPVTGSMPFQVLTAAFVRADFATAAQTTGGSGTVVVTNGADTTVFGTRVIQWPQLLSSTVTQEYQTAALGNRWNTLEYVPTNIQVKLSQIKSLQDTDVAEQFALLLDMEHGIWERLELKYKPVGTTTTVTTQNIITGRTISGTPEDMIVSLRTKPWYNWSAFILDSSVDGILNTSRLGW